MDWARIWELVDARIERRILARVAHAVRVVLEAADDSQIPRAAMQGLDEQRHADVEVWQHYGLASRPPAGAEGIAVPLVGPGGPVVVVATQDRDSVPALAASEVVLFQAAGATIRLAPDGSIAITGVTSVSVDGTAISLNGPGAPVARVGDTVTITGVDGTGATITAAGIISSGSATVTAGG